VPGTPAPIADRPAPRQIARDTVPAIKEYGNTSGVPMTSSHMTFHPAYRAKPVRARRQHRHHAGGVESAQPGVPEPGDLVVLIGALTGNEGMHGASAGSAGSTMDVTAVLIGAPLEQVKFRKALIDLRDAGCMRALTDIGGAGLNSAVGEIGDPCGVWINTALVPLKTSALPMWRILLSESQERMLLAVKPERHAEVVEILERHQVRTTVIGRFSGNGRYTVFHQPEQTEHDVLELTAGELPADPGELGFDVAYELLDFDEEQVGTNQVPAADAAEVAWPELSADELGELLAKVVSDPEVASQHYADSQYDCDSAGPRGFRPPTVFSERQQRRRQPQSSRRTPGGCRSIPRRLTTTSWSSMASRWSFKSPSPLRTATSPSCLRTLTKTARLPGSYGWLKASHRDGHEKLATVTPGA
jgi:phosphoribosylformylglycinamidine (FGAM) synthase-like enzyme